MPWDHTGKIYTEQPFKIDFTRANDLEYVQKVNRQVADHLFPGRNPTAMMLKMFEEVGEIVANPTDPEEVADVIIMLLDHIDQLGYPVGPIILRKLEKNMHRKWRVTQSGIAKHIKDDRG